MAQKNFLFDVLLPRVELISWLLALVGFGLKWGLVPAGSPLLALGLLTLATVYFLYAFKLNRHEEEAEEESFGAQRPLPIEQPKLSFLVDTLAPKALGILAAMTLIGVEFKLLLLPRAQLMLVRGILPLAATVLLLALAGRLVRKYMFVLGLGIVMWDIPAETLAHRFHRDDPVLAEKIIFSMHHPSDPKAAADVKEYLRAKRDK